MVTPILKCNSIKNPLIIATGIGEFEFWHSLGRYLLFISFKKPISIPVIQSCTIFNEITVVTRPLWPVSFYAQCFVASETSLG